MPTASTYIRVILVALVFDDEIVRVGVFGVFDDCFDRELFFGGSLVGGVFVDVGVEDGVVFGVVGGFDFAEDVALAGADVGGDGGVQWRGGGFD